jgi:hypothetical protein
MPLREPREYLEAFLQLHPLCVGLEVFLVPPRASRLSAYQLNSSGVGVHFRSVQLAAKRAYQLNLSCIFAASRPTLCGLRPEMSSEGIFLSFQRSVGYIEPQNPFRDCCKKVTSTTGRPDFLHGVCIWRSVSFL